MEIKIIKGKVTKLQTLYVCLVCNTAEAFDTVKERQHCHQTMEEVGWIEKVS